MTHLSRRRFVQAGAGSVVAGAIGLATARSASAAVDDDIEDAIHDQGGQVFNVAEPFAPGTTGAKGDTKIIPAGATISAGSLSTLNWAGGSFVSGDQGKTITVQGAGASGAVLTTTIASVSNATTVTLTAAASTAVSAAEFSYGTDDTAAILNAVAAAKSTQSQDPTAVGGGTFGYAATVLLPPGIYTITDTIDLVSSTVNLMGAGGRCLPDVSSAASVLLCAAAGAGVAVDSWAIFKGFCVHGNHLATAPLTSHAGSFSTYFDVWVTDSAAVGWTIISSQNNNYYDCGSINSATDGVYFDGGTGGLDFWHFTESGSGRYGLYSDTKTTGGWGSYLTNTEDINFFGGSSSSGGRPGTSRVNLVGAIAWGLIGMTIRGDDLTGPTVDLTQGLAHWIDMSGCTISAAAGKSCILVEGGAGLTAYLFLKTDGVRFLSGGNSVEIANAGVYTYSAIDWAYDGTTNGPTAASGLDPIDTLLGGRTGSWQTATLASPWTAGTVKYRMRSDGLIEMKGWAQRASGSGNSTIFTLPTGCRPNKGNGATIKPRVAQSTGANFVSITSGGAVQSTAAAGVTVHFDGLQFPTD